MDTYTFKCGQGWMARLFGNHPLVRRSDRVEAYAALAVIVITVLFVPVAAAVGTSVHDGLAAQYAADAANSHQVDATVTADSNVIPEPYSVNWVTHLQWRIDGTTRRDVIYTNQKMKTGDTERIWVDSRGVRVPTPPDSDEATLTAVCIALAVLSLPIVIGLLLLMLLRLRLTQYRFTQWDRELDELLGDRGKRRRPESL